MGLPSFEPSGLKGSSCEDDGGVVEQQSLASPVWEERTHEGMKSVRWVGTGGSCRLRRRPLVAIAPRIPTLLKLFPGEKFKLGRPVAWNFYLQKYYRKRKQR